MKKLIIHIGYPKTATTTLQHNLLSTLYSEKKIEWIHGNSFFNDNSKLRVSCAAHISQITSQNITKYTQENLNAEREMLQNIQCPISVISDEDLAFKFPGFSWAYCNDAVQNLKKLKDTFSSYFDKIEILITIRSQQTIVPSFYVQCYNLISQENSLFGNIHDWICERFSNKKKNTIFNYFKMYQSCVENFSSENVHVHLYEDLLHEKEFYYSQLAHLFETNFDEVKLAFESRSNNVTSKSKDGYYSKGNTLFYKKFINPIKQSILKRGNNNFYSSARKIYKALTPRVIREKKTEIKKPDENEQKLIYSFFKESNECLTAATSLSIEKMKRYGYI